MGTRTRKVPMTTTTDPTIPADRPDWRPRWRRILTDTSVHIDERLDFVAAMNGLAPVSTMPRPSQVASWSISDWRDFAKTLGLEELPQTKHQIAFAHPRIPFLRFGRASSTSENNSSMNLMQDLRRNYRKLLSDILTIAAFTFKDVENNEVITEFDFRLRLKKNVEDPAFLNSIITAKTKLFEMQHSALGLSVPIANLFKYLRVIRTEFGFSYRNTLNKVLSDEIDEAAKQDVITRICNSEMIADTGCATTSELLSGVKDYLDVLRAEERQRKELKRAERAARNAPKQSAPAEAFKPLVKTQQQVFEETNTAIKKSIETQTRIAFEALKRLDALQLQAFPGGDTEALKVALAERDDERQANAMAEKEIDAANDRIKALEQLLEESELTNPWEGRMQTLALSLQRLLSDNDITKLIFNLDEARKLVADAVALTTPKTAAQSESSAA